MDVQHLHPGFPQGIELPLPGLVILIVIGLVDLGGSGHSFSFALTSLLAMLSLLLRLRHGLGTLPFSWSLVLRTVLIESTSRSGEYFTLRNVS